MLDCRVADGGQHGGDDVHHDRENDYRSSARVPARASRSAPTPYSIIGDRAINSSIDRDADHRPAGQGGVGNRSGAECRARRTDQGQAEHSYGPDPRQAEQHGGAQGPATGGRSGGDLGHDGHRSVGR